MKENSHINLLLSCEVCGKNLRLSTEGLNTHKGNICKKGQSRHTKYTRKIVNI